MEAHLPAKGKEAEEREGLATEDSKVTMEKCGGGPQQVGGTLGGGPKQCAFGVVLLKQMKQVFSFNHQILP